MSLGKARKSISVRGGGTLLIRQLDPTPTNAYSDLGYIKDSTLEDADVMVGEVDESGVLPDFKSGSETCSWKLTLKQATQDEINFLRNAINMYFEAYYKVTLGNGNIQEISIPLCRVSPMFNAKFAANAERTLDIVITMLAPKAAFTRGVVAFNVVAGQPYILVDNATAQFNTSNTEASTLAAAIL